MESETMLHFASMNLLDWVAATDNDVGRWSASQMTAPLEYLQDSRTHSTNEYRPPACGLRVHEKVRHVNDHPKMQMLAGRFSSNLE